MSESKHYGQTQIEQVYERIERLKETHSNALMDHKIPEDSDYVQAEGITTRNWDGYISEVRHEAKIQVADKLLNVVPEPEPMAVQRFRALVLTMDTMRGEGETIAGYYEPEKMMQNVAIQYREEARTLIEDRLVLERPTDDEDADVIYIYDPVSKLRQTTALGGYKKEYDEAMLRDQKSRLAEEILYQPIPRTVPRV